MPHRLIHWLNPPPRPYLMQRHAGLLLLCFGLVAVLFPVTRLTMQFPPVLEWVLFGANLLVGVLLLLVRRLSWLAPALLAAVAVCWMNAAAWTFALGVNTATPVYLLEIYFLIRLLGKVRADRESELSRDA